MARAPIDFAGLAAALLQRIDELVRRWLPNGIERADRWYVGDFYGSPGESANVNLKTGQWIDNAAPDEDCGGDLISLYARIRNISNGEAARELMQEMGWSRPTDEPPPVRTSAHGAALDEPPAHGDDDVPATAGTAPAARSKRTPKWRAIVPVPPHAPPPDFVFGYRDKKRGDAWVELDAVRTWAYRFEGQLYGHVARFERTNSDGELVKDTVARTWCENVDDGRGLSRWHWKQWDAPRPLYVPAELLSGDLPVVVVEGEKCAQAGQQLLGHEFDFVSWPGGCKAWAMAAWGWLTGRTVYLWPDCDAQRERLTKAEREAGLQAESKAYQPASKQPGMLAMVHIGSVLVADHGCSVFMCRIPAPGAVGDGWDIADAIEQGWDAEQVRAFIRGAVAFVPPSDEARVKARSTPSLAGAGDEDEDPLAWRAKLLESSTGAIKVVRENVVLALDGMPLPEGKWLPGIPAAAGVLAYNEFTSDLVKLKPAPWASPAGAWTDVDDLLMGEWLVREHWLPSMPRGTLDEAARMVAFRHKYHPVRQYLDGLAWDGEKRLATWIRQACLEIEEWDDSDPLHRYLARVGTYFIMGMCKRAIEPGCKFDYMLVLESPEQGRGKSSLFRLLGGEWFADTGLVLGEKDSFAQLQGRWVYEMSELDALSRADVKMVKQYIASQSDYFRMSYDRRAREYPRQGVFGGTTNDDHYLVDPTGNRRFWPVRVTRRVDLAWLASVRDQLFAEALERLKAGKRYFPLPEEEEELFVPQQQLRMVENAYAAKIAGYLHPQGNPTGPNSDGMLINEISLVDLLAKLGIGLEKLGPGRHHEKQAGAALRALGWTERRTSLPGRPRHWCRPQANPRSKSPTQPTQADSTVGADDACPF